MADHGPVDVVVLFLMFGEELLWGRGSWAEKGVLNLRGGFWHVMVVELVGVELVILGCVFPDESSEFYRGVGSVPMVECGDRQAFVKTVAHCDGFPWV